MIRCLHTQSSAVSSKDSFFTRYRNIKKSIYQKIEHEGREINERKFQLTHFVRQFKPEILIYDEWNCTKLLTSWETLKEHYACMFVLFKSKNYRASVFLRQMIYCFRKISYHTSSFLLKEFFPLIMSEYLISLLHYLIIAIKGFSLLLWEKIYKYLYLILPCFIYERIGRMMWKGISLNHQLFLNTRIYNGVIKGSN